MAQFVQLLYNVVDRVFIGHLPGTDSMALTGVGLVFPLTTLIAAFTNLFGTGGTPVFSIARGAGDQKRARKAMGNTFTMLLITALILTVFSYLFRKPILYLFGASDASYIYADAYLKIYLLGTVCSMIAVGMNGFINAQGFPRIGMFTTVIGAVLNLILDPIMIYGLGMGVAGAALATVISQTVSALWVIRFLQGKQAVIRLEKKYLPIDWHLVKDIVSIGLAGFFVQGTNCAVQIVCNVTLKMYGGDLYVGIMTIINSVREILTLPIHGLTSGAQPVLGYNYGAKKYERVRAGIRCTAVMGFSYTLIAWLVSLVGAEVFMKVFTSDRLMITEGKHALWIYFFGFFFMAFQFTGQSVFTALGYSKHAIFFSLLRKVIIVVPLTILLPILGLGINGVYIAEPTSNILGGLASFTTMYFVIYKRLGHSSDSD